ncbi:MAG: hypothetical protein WAT39_10280, partial [Planctomycetota bacterium]
MIARLWRSAAGLCFRHCLRVAALPVLVAATAAVLGERWFRPQLGGEQAPAAASPWLLLPLAVGAVACTVAALLFWPGFCRGRPGRDQVDRVQRGALAGCAAATAGALLAQWLLLTPVALVLVPCFGAPGEANAHVAVPAAAEPLLGPGRPRLALAAPAGSPFRELWLCPLAALPVGPLQPTTIEVFADGVSLGLVPHGFRETREAARLAFAPRPFAQLELVVRGGTVPLAFPPSTLVLIAAEAHGRLANAMVLALLALLPSFVALALGALVGSVAAVAT